MQDQIQNACRMCSTECGQSFIISSISENSKIKKRLCDIGITKGTMLTHLFDSPMGDPAAYLVRNTIIALRHCDSENIEVYKL
jgi:ferrous iron transport protein A